MFDNIGSKIKKLTFIVFWLGVAGSVIFGFALLITGSFMAGIATLVLGCLMSWISGFVPYAFGEIIENTERQTALLGRLYDEQQKANELLSHMQK